MFGRAARPAGAAPRVFAADGLNAFVAPARKVFRYSVGLFVHIADIHAQSAYNVQEGLDGETKPLLRRRGGFKITDSPLIGLAIPDCNFRPHTAPGGETPAEVAGICVEGDGRIPTLLEAAAA